MLHHAAPSCCCCAGQQLLNLPGGLCQRAKGERAAQVPACLPCALRRQVAVPAQRLSSVPRAGCLTEDPSASTSAPWLPQRRGAALSSQSGGYVPRQIGCEQQSAEQLQVLAGVLAQQGSPAGAKHARSALCP